MINRATEAIQSLWSSATALSGEGSVLNWSSVATATVFFTSYHFFGIAGATASTMIYFGENIAEASSVAAHNFLEYYNPSLAHVLDERPEQFKESVLQLLSSSRTYNALDKFGSIYKIGSQFSDLIYNKTGYNFHIADTILDGILNKLNIQDMVVKDDVKGIQYVKPISDITSDITIKAESVEKHYDLKSLNLSEGVTFKTGLILNAEDNRFGEWSGMDFKKDSNGNLLLEAVSDRGNFLESQMKFDNDGVLEQLTYSKIGKIQGLSENEDDIEELALYQDNDGNVNYIITHENVTDRKTKTMLSDNKISVYKGGNFEDGNSRSVFTPESIKGLEHNKGLEALGVSPNKHILAINEYADKNTADLHELHIWKDLTFQEEILNKQYYKSSPGYQVSGLTFLSNGGLMVLERNFKQKAGGLAEDYLIKVKFINPVALENPQDGLIVGHEILEINNVHAPDKYSLADNYESIAAAEFDNGHISIFLLTDDNRAPTQRTLLLQFDIDEKLINEDSFGAHHSVDHHLGGYEL